MLLALATTGFAGDHHGAYGVPGQYMYPTDGWKSSGHVVTTKASSEGKRHPASAVLEPDPATAWCEAVDGDGVGEWLELRFNEPVSIEALLFQGGFFLDEDHLRSHGRVRQLRLEIDKHEAIWNLDDPATAAIRRAEQEGLDGIRAAPATLWVGGDDPPWSRKAMTRRLRLTILAVYPGEKNHETCISGVFAFLREPG